MNKRLQIATRPILRLGCLLMAALPPLAEAGLREEMGEAAFAEAGLTKLSPAELARLEEHLEARDSGRQKEHLREIEQRLAEEQEKARVTAQEKEKKDFGLQQPASPTIDRIESRIVNRFTGWTGNTVFQLENGQVWRQRMDGRYYRAMDKPSVILEKGTFGYWMTLVETGAKVPVSRVK